MPSGNRDVYRGLIGADDVSAELSRNFLSPGNGYFPLPKTSDLIPPRLQ